MSRALAALALAVVGLVVAGPVTAATFLDSERVVTIGAHNATASPTFDGHVTIVAGPLLPELRMLSDAPLGVGAEVVLRDSPDTDLQRVLAQDAAIASQPEGEIAAMTSEMTQMALAALRRGVAAGVIAMVIAGGVWWALGPRRRRELREAWPPDPRPALVLGVLGFVVLGAALAYAQDPDTEREVAWVPIRQEFPELPDEPRLDRVEISRGAATATSKAIVQGALDTYQASLSFYSDLTEKTRGIAVRAPEDGQTTALVVTDRHNNVGMDPVAREVADAANASFVIDLGDDTSNGASWEAFSIKSLRQTFADLPIVAVAGNHDTGDHVLDEMERRDFIVLDGEPVEVEGVRMLGESDPRSSGLTAGYNGNEDDNIAAIRDQNTALAETACEDGDVSLLLTHSAASAKAAVAQGCVDLAISGHLHRQEGPVSTEGPNGTSTRLTIGSTGGAVYAFALGTKLRRDAQVAVLTFEDSRVVGLQVVTFKPGGVIDVGDYTTLPVAATP
ncbi:metallophosphoesterase family protein [Aeromicrobium duanguangcaii]|uniref:Metallophosphoesterase family protein n=1 Tax=Aeromicrobium duanguangcaii TaxID=2968086 RepID=A0ABY5KEZ9_9ACTN|nr:metallophosphoesterase family protein [Aeromicrobium duanguangcaii]MCD9155370.1 metallophosphoesterase family protein [Aeromicrobium duanguangcaii]MCL3838338.1 metallophosphoesterase family protein [Aeromicrobium duanguangcaii]UUI68358.1 metallophosphoesterase family protein [Aeromicrobium duanguangcaii]